MLKALAAKLIAFIRPAVVAVILPAAVVAGVAAVVPFANETLADEKNQPPHEAVRRGNERDFILFIAKSEDVNATDDDGVTLLSLAAAHGYTVAATLLIANGADVNAGDDDGSTPLKWASFRGNAAMASLLIDNGADVNAKNNADWTSLHLTSSPETAALLLENGADVNAKTKEGLTPLDFAKMDGGGELQSLIKRHGGRCGLHC